MKTEELTGVDLLYWVARANMKGSNQEANVLRRHYGDGPVKHLPREEPAMRSFVKDVFGTDIPEKHTWQ